MYKIKKQQEFIVIKPEYQKISKKRKLVLLAILQVWIGQEIEKISK